ncbi:MAG: sulfate reduction electron transfer complex DsrMKJOP subunit DsrP [Methanobacteriota archaeon]
MFESVLKGDRKYWGWIAFLLAIIAVGLISYSYQWRIGLGITGMSQSVSWGLYIANFTFLVGVAASAVLVVLPAYIYDYKKFANVTALGEFLAVAAVTMCVLFIVVDLGQPMRLLNIMLHPNISSVMIWDMIVLTGYLLLNIVIGWYVLDAKDKDVPPRGYIKPLIYLSIPWAISIHTVTAYLYGGLIGRPFWFTALMAPRFLASAFASGPALVILASLVLRRYTKFDPGKDAINKLAEIVTFAMIISMFFIGCEIFTVGYGAHPEHMLHFKYLFFGIAGHAKLVPWIWISFILGFIAIALLVNPGTRKRENTLMLACAFVFTSIWIDKGLGLIIPGYIPSQIGDIFEYWPTALESLITLGVWGVGLLILTLLYKTTISVMTKVEVPEVEKVPEVEVPKPPAAPAKPSKCGLCGAEFKSMDGCCEHAEKEHKIVKASCDMVCEEIK